MKPQTFTNSVFGQCLRGWRMQRGLSQLELALQAGTTPRYVSFIETGRSRPGLELVMRLAGVLDIPISEQNQLLVLAGLRPVYPNHGLDDPNMQSLNAILEKVLNNHDPYPAWVIARGWRFLRANTAAERLFPGLCNIKPEDLIDYWFGSDQFRDMVENYADVIWAGLLGLQREATQTGDARLIKLLARAKALVKDLPKPTSMLSTDLPVVCPRFRVGGQTIRTISSVMRFDSAIEVTTSELKIELMFPADEVGEKFFKNAATQPSHRHE
jgi:transcriptional regulator with XRE-family HTH domain